MNEIDVLRMQQVAYVMAQTVAAYAEIEALRVENDDNHFTDADRAARVKALRAIPDSFGLGHNDVLTTLRING